MRTFAKIACTLILGTAVYSHSMDEEGWASIYESIAAFENRTDASAAICPGCFNRPGYVKPIINNLGNILNSNWYVSASVPQSMSMEAGLPLAIIPIGDDDKTFSENGMSVPTIFGDHGDPLVQTGLIYGNETLNGLGVFLYPYAQVGFGMYHARAVMRFMYLPAISELQRFSLFGFGLQYSFGQFFQHKLPAAAKPLDVSLVFGYSMSGIGYQPEDYEGQLDLDVTAFTIDMVVGYKPIKMFEIMMTLGYQYANMESSGTLTCATIDAAGQPQGFFGQELHPNISVKGNNGFKFGLEVAFQIGASFHPVAGFDYAGKSSFTTNVLYFKQQFGEDENQTKNEEGKK